MTVPYHLNLSSDRRLAEAFQKLRTRVVYYKLNSILKGSVRKAMSPFLKRVKREYAHFKKGKKASVGWNPKGNEPKHTGLFYKSIKLVDISPRKGYYKPAVYAIGSSSKEYGNVKFRLPRTKKAKIRSHWPIKIFHLIEEGFNNIRYGRHVEGVGALEGLEDELLAREREITETVVEYLEKYVDKYVRKGNSQQ